MSTEAKRPKLGGEGATADSENGAASALSHLGSFQMSRVLSESSEHKRVTMEGTMTTDGQKAIVILEKTPFNKETLGQVLSEDSRLRPQFINDIYGKYLCDLKPDLNFLKASVIHPATEKHVSKYESKPTYMIVETPALYHSVTLPFLKGETFSIEWVYNILSHKKEAETIVYENPDPEEGYILLPDYKWNGKQVEDLYLICIVHRRDIMSLRDLRAEHLPMLRDLWARCTEAIHAKYDVPPSQIRAYFHYQPSYYHLHIHFSYLGYSAPGINTERAHLLSTVISNIEAESSYYDKAELPFCVKENDNLFKYYQELGYQFHPAKESATASADQLKPGFISGLTKFFLCMGKAKHEPCGEHWTVTFAESAWRLAIMAMCLPRDLDRKRLVKIALTSALTSLGEHTDHCSEWPQKTAEVKKFLFDNLELSKAAELYEYYLAHVKARIGSNLKTSEEKAYRKLLEFEETLLQWEELRKEGEGQDKESIERLFRRMSEVGFPGFEKLEMFKDTTELGIVLNFIIQVSNLVSLDRTGWVRMKIRDPEHVAGHMFRMGMMALVMEKPGSNFSSILNGTSVIVSLIHDIAECIVGDITPEDKVTPEEKHEKEMEAMRSLVKKLPGPLAKDFFNGFERYEFQKEGDFEAHLTKDLDKYDMILQAYEYEEQGLKKNRGKFLEDFFRSTKGVFKTDLVKALVQHLYELREKLHQKQ